MFKHINHNHLKGEWFPGRSPERFHPVILVHGGGWISNDSSSVHGVAGWLQEKGFTVFTPNYRKVDQFPWPACLEDIQETADWVGQQMPRPAVFMGLSAGGHLALMAALSRKGVETVAGIVSVAGVTRLGRGPSAENPDLLSPLFLDVFFGSKGDHTEKIRLAEPFPFLSGRLPALLCVHSIHDLLVLPEDSWELISAWRSMGGRAEMFEFEGQGSSHGIWRPPYVPPERRRLLQSLETRILTFLTSLAETDGVSDAGC